VGGGGWVIIMLTMYVYRFNYGIVKFTDVVEENKVWCTLKLYTYENVYITH
jgi:hypothetical protein